jgi:hypothetical protein
MRGSQAWSIFFSILFFVPLVTPEDEIKEIFKKVEENVQQIKTLKGRILKKTIINKGKTFKTTSKFYFIAPRRLFLEQAFPHQQLIINGNRGWLYYPQAKKALELSPRVLEKFKTQGLDFSHFLDLNILPELKKKFNFEISKKEDQEVTLVALPKKETQIASKVVVKINSQKGIILTYQIFNSQAELISSVKYQDYRLFDNSIWFPLKITSQTIVGKNIFQEELIFQRLRMNLKLDEARFNFSPSREVEILSAETFLKNLERR